MCPDPLILYKIILHPLISVLIILFIQYVFNFLCWMRAIQSLEVVVKT